jgi:hypothetical protein
MPLPFATPDRLLARFRRTGEPDHLGALFDRTAPALLRIAPRRRAARRRPRALA